MSDIKDAIAQLAMGDLLGQGEAKETFEKTGKVDLSQVVERVPMAQRKAVDESPGVRVVKPLDASQLVKAVTESMIAQSLLEDNEYKEKAAIADQVADEAKEFASKEISKILKGLR
jgi:hypothetical protein